jgi:hypothetical protein
VPITPVVVGLPGFRAAKSTNPRVVFRGGISQYLPGGKTIDGTYSRDPGNTDNVDVLRCGTLMGKITASEKYAPSVIGVTTNAEAAGSTSIEVGAAVVTELVRRVGASGTFKLTGPPTAGGVVATETVTFSGATGTTITATALANAFVAGSFIQPSDGSETPITFIPDGDGIRVTDNDGTNLTVQFPLVPTAGSLYSDKLIPWPSDAALQQWIVNRLNDAANGKFNFDHAY